ncbi:MAG: acyltransferase [Clostridiales bacterium]|nr:acyltransferase [Clostridiales bacterium]
MKKRLTESRNACQNLKPDLQSAVIDFLRFPLIIGVLLLHNYPATVNIVAGQIGNDTLLPVSTICREFFSQTLGRICVPTFFFISGFLFFLHIDKFTGGVYVKKLKSRAKTLLIPYLFWNLLSLAVFYTVYHAPILSSFFSDTQEYTWQYLLQALWALPHDGAKVANYYPIAYQFWFIRDLMVMVFLTPVIYFLVKKFRLYTVSILGILWFFEWWQMYLPWLAGQGLDSKALFFFTAGAWFGINKRNVIDDADKMAKWAFMLYPPIAIVNVLTRLYVPDIRLYLSCVNNSAILIGVAASFALAAYLLKTGKARVNTFLASASFFVFAVHDPLFLSRLRNRVFAVFRPESDGSLTTVYFLLVIVVAVVALGLYWLLQRYLPKFTRIITGGR